MFSTRINRRRLRPAAGMVLAASLALLSAAAGAQDAGQSDEAYHVRALRGGGSQLREIDGQKVIEFPQGVRIVHGDVTITADKGFHYADDRVTRLLGNVKIVQQTLTMWGDEGTYTEATDRAVLRENVRIVDEGWEVTCDLATYSRTTGSAWLTGDVTARDSVTTLYADSLFYNRNSERTEAFGDVEMTNADEGFTLRGRHGIYYRDRGEGVVDRDPRLTVDPDADEPVTVVSDTMRVYPDSSHALAYYLVKIIKGNTVTQCDSAVLYDDRNRAELYGNPLAKQDNVSMAGNVMVLHYDDDEVYQIDILGGAEIREAQRDSLVVGRDSWMQGDTVSLHLHENRVDSILVERNASSEYFPQARPYGGKVEGNSVRGDQMFFRFEGDSLTYVRVTGNASGVYRYVDLGPDETVDSLRTEDDTTLVYRAFRDEAEKVVYSAARLEYFADRGDLVLDQSAKIKYQNSELTGENIIYYSSQQLLDATGGPVLTEKGEKFYGERMNYDMESEAGLVTEGSTQFQEGYYTGDHVAKVSDNEMKVWGSNYTTCDLKVPHYHFSAKEMKVYPRDKVITGPIWLYIGETPIAYLPFMAANLRRGRRSGILRPELEFGFDRGGGRYIRNWGYYWATNDYMDYTFTGDFNEDAQLRIFNQLRYALRYRFNGNVEYNFIRELDGFTNEWSVQARHNHTLGERFSLNSNLRFVSSDNAQRQINRIDDVDRVTDRVIRSTVSLRKQWDSVGFSTSYTREQKLNITDPNTNKLQVNGPSVNLSIPSRNLFFGQASGAGKAGFWETLLSNTRFSPSLSGDRRYTEKQFEFEEVLSSRQGLGFQSPQKIGFLTVSPSLRMSNSTVRTDFEEIEHTEAVDETTTVLVPAFRDVKTDNTFSWNTGAAMSTNFYGTFYPRVGNLRGLRHKISPQVSWTYTPDVGNEGPSSQSFRVSLQQSLDLKVLRSKNETRESGDAAAVPDAAAGESAGAEEDVRKIDGAVIWSLSSSYNPRPQRRDRGWANISSSVNTNVLGSRVSLTQSFDPYDRVVLSTSLSSGVRFTGTHPFGKAETVAVRELNIVAASDTTRGRGTASFEQTGDVLAGRDELAVEEGRLPWSLSMDFSYNKSRGLDPRSTLRFNGQVDLTKTWKLTYSTDYDFEDRAIRGQSYQITRDLHCWEMSFSRSKLGEEWQFYFKINLKAHQEIYAEQGRRGLGGGTFGTSSFGF